jgi:high-affinity iron transporter
MLAEFVITFRETLEAALIVGIALAFLARTKNTHLNVHVYLGVAAGIVASVAAGVLLFSFFGGLEGTLEQLFEGTLMLVAAVAIFTMILWMLSQRHFAKQIENEMHLRIEKKYAIGIALFIFISVFREGLETVIFLASALLQGTGGILLSWAGGIGGIGAAVALGFLLFETSLRVDLKHFFTAANLFLALFGAGILAHSAHEFQEAGILPSQSPLWSTKGLLDQSSTEGSFLRMMFGYADEPTSLEAFAYLSYIALFGAAYFAISNRKEAEGEKAKNASQK